MALSKTNMAFCALAILGALSMGALSTWSPTVPVAVLALTAIVAATWSNPKSALTIWLLAVCMVPYWVGTGIISGFVPLASVLGALFVAVAVLRGQWTPRWWDFAFFAFVAFGYLAVTFNHSPQGEWFAWVSHWAVAYMVARVLIPAAGRDFTYKAVAVILAVVGACASIEFLLSFHPFVDLAFPNKPFATWHGIQSRGGYDRSEWTFGHSISLGSSLAMGIPFAVAAQFRWRTRILLVALMASGIVFTLSRSGLIAAALTIGLVVVLQAGIKATRRIAIGSATAAAAWWISNNFTDVVGNASEDTHASSLYRVLIYQNLVDAMDVFGRTPIAVTSGETTYYGTFRSIDSAFLFLGLAYGWAFPVALLAAYAALIARALFGRTSAAEIALLGTLPALVTVALITQYQMVVWFMVGAAVTFASKDYATVESVTAPSAANATRNCDIAAPTPASVGADSAAALE